MESKTQRETAPKSAKRSDKSGTKQGPEGSRGRVTCHERRHPMSTEERGREAKGREGKGRGGRIEEETTEMTERNSTRDDVTAVCKNDQQRPQKTLRSSSSSSPRIEQGTHSDPASRLSRKPSSRPDGGALPIETRNASHDPKNPKMFRESSGRSQNTALLPPATPPPFPRTKKWEKRRNIDKQIDENLQPRAVPENGRAVVRQTPFPICPVRVAA